MARTAGDHYLLVGEAAGQVKTSTAGGIYYGLLCAELAAEVIDEALKKGDASEKNLMRYHWQWTRLLGPELRAGLKLQRLAAAMSDDEIDRLFQIIQGDGILSGLEQRTQFDWHRLSISFLLSHRYLTTLFAKHMKHSVA